MVVIAGSLVMYTYGKGILKMMPSNITENRCIGEDYFYSGSFFPGGNGIEMGLLWWESVVVRLNLEIICGKKGKKRIGY